MDVLSKASKGTVSAQTGDAHLQPTPDYGTLCQDAALKPSAIEAQFIESQSKAARPGSVKFRILCAAITGMVAALVVSKAGGMGAVWNKFSPSPPRKEFVRYSEVISDKEIDGQKPQRQAEILLEQAVAHADHAPALTAAKIESRVGSWQGKIQWDAQLADLTTAALNTNVRDVQNSAIEVQIAAYGLAKNESTVDTLVGQASSSNLARKAWALWSLGLLANRGIGTDRAVAVLAAYAKNSPSASSPNATENADSEHVRRWAVEGLALAGTTATIAPLLDAMHNDPSATVRERAACNLAQSGMLSHEQRMIAVPQLIDYSGDAALDGQTRSWAFQALSDITGQRLPNDSAAWREWYQSNSVGN